MVVGDPLIIYRTLSFQPAGTNVFVILKIMSDGVDGYIGLQDGATVSNIRITTANGISLTKFNIDNTNYYYAASAGYSSTGIQIK